MKFYLGGFFVLCLIATAFFAQKNAGTAPVPFIPTKEKKETATLPPAPASVRVANLVASSNIEATQIEKLKKNISAEEIQFLKEQVMNSEASGTLRRTSLYVLTQMGLPAAPALAEIIMLEIPRFENLSNPHASGSYRHNSEIALRLTALEALDLLAPTSLEVQKQIQEIAESMQEPTLKLLSRISLEGIRTKRPQKLHRAIEAMMAERN